MDRLNKTHVAYSNAATEGEKKSELMLMKCARAYGSSCSR